MAAIVPSAVNRVASTPTVVTPAGGGDTIRNVGRTLIAFRNTNVADRTVTIASYAPAVAGSGVGATNLSVVVPASTGVKWVGPFPKDVWNNPADESLHLTYDAVTGLTMEVISCD